MDTVIVGHGTEVLAAPLSRDEIEAMQMDGEPITACVIVNADDLIEGDIEMFDDIVSEKITGAHRLQDIAFRPVDADGRYGIVFEVSGYIDEGDLDYLP